MKPYDHRKIEAKWQAFWSKNKVYTTPDKAPGKDNFYLLVEFPYPSGNLHVGHWYAFAVPDILARYQRMKGKNVLYPVGFDAFGLPAENAAIKNKVNPRAWTEKNIAYMSKQIRSMGTSFDWSREVQTIDPGYYKWTQWMFLQFFKNGLAYRKETAVNWCPKDKTVLANEQVVDGKCERCGSEVVQKQMLQWNLKITDYADRLIDGLDALDWPEPIKEAQRAWIGRSEGAEIDFRLDLGKKDNPRFLLLHGREGSPKDNFFPWLKKELELLGHEVEAPNLPGTKEPDDETQADFVEKHCTIDEKTVIIGHSFGGVVAMRLLERGHKVCRAVFVSTPLSGRFKDGKVRASVARACKKGFDFKKIRKGADSFIVVPDTRDPIVPIEDAETLAKELSALYMPGRGSDIHFTGKKEPDVLMACVPTVRVFTTRADTLYGATFLSLAPEHPFVQQCCASEACTNGREVEEYVKEATTKTELERQETKEKTGVELKGVKAVNPATGEKISLWVADYVLGSYGTGAVMGVPAHDERDWEFAKKYKIASKEVIEPLVYRYSGLDAIHPGATFTDRPAALAFVQHWSEDKYLAVRYKPTNTCGCVSGGIEKGERPEETAKREVREETGYVHAKVVRKLGGTIHCKYYSIERERNTFPHFTAFLMKLTDGVREEVAPHEAEKHETTWLSKEEMDAFINREDMRIAWERTHGKTCYTGKGILADSGEFSGMTSEEALPKIGEKYGRLVKQYRLRDWIVSRQRYWGVPIPIVHCPKCGPVAVPDKDLPVELPAVKDYLPDGRGKSPLAKVKKFVAAKCPQCKGKAERETDTLDTFVDSSWYFLRYTDPKNKKKFADAKKMKQWLPVNLYSGGAEHTTMHVLYSRFWHKALYDLGLVADSEPYRRRMNRSIILGPDGQKMSKSRGNVIDPDEVVARLGTDTVRMYLAFIGPYNEVSSFPWNPDGVVGVRRFLERVWKLQESVQGTKAPSALFHKTIKKVGEDIVAMKFNTAISQMMILLNAIEKTGSLSEPGWEILLKLIAPFAPHLAEELWQEGGRKRSIHLEQWPSYDEKLLLEDTVGIAVQINGKTRGEATVAAGADKAATEAAAKEAVAARLEGKKILRVIVVPGRLVNFVIES